MSLSVKLYVSIFLVMFIGLALFTVFNVTNQTSNLVDLVQLSAVRTTDLIKQSIHYSMLINRKSDIDQIFDNFEKMQGFEVIRIYDKTGTIMYTTHPDEKYTEVPKSADACQSCHESFEPLKALVTKDLIRFTTSDDGRRVLSMINPIQNEPSCSKSGCHKSMEEQSILGVLDVQMSLELVDANIEASQHSTIATSAILVICVLMVVGILIWTQIRRPIQELISGTEAIAMGDLDYSISTDRRDELGSLAKSFNIMVGELRRARNEITEWSNTLQKRVEEKTDEIENIQSQLIQVEKMASLGKLASTVAHELNNPLAGILTYTRLTLKRLKERELTEELLASIDEDLTMVSEETTRCGNIVKNLLLFSRRDVGEHAQHELLNIINHCLQLIQHHLLLHKIQLIKEMPATAITLQCDKEQLRQALLAILVNAIESMPDGGDLTVMASETEDQIRISVKDSGEGIDSEHLPHIFEPFYSSKKGGDGVGLGLSVAYGIIERHQGNIEVESTPSEGACFTIVLPKSVDN